MRLIVGIDEDGHQFAVRVDTFKRFKKYILDTINENNWSGYIYTDLLNRVKAHDTNESLLEDDELIDSLYSRRILHGRTTKYPDIKGTAIKWLEEQSDPYKEMREAVEKCQTEDEITDNDYVMDSLYELNAFGQGRDRFTSLQDPCPGEDDD